GRDLAAPPPPADVGHVRWLVHRRADAVADVLPHDVEPGALDRRLDGCAQVAQAGAGHQLGDARLERPARHLDEPLGDRVGPAHGGGEGGVAVVAVDDRPAVDRDDVALIQPAVVGDAVHDDLVDAGADHRRVAVVAEEVRPGAPAGEHLPTDGVELQQGRAGPDGGGDALVHLGHDPAGAAHRADLVRGPPAHGRPQPPRRASTTASRRSVTSSAGPVPSTVSSRPRSRYQSTSGAVFASYSARRLAMASGVSSSRWTTGPPQTSQVQSLAGGASTE